MKNSLKKWRVGLILSVGCLSSFAALGDTAPTERAGQVIYETSCVKCHGPHQAVSYKKGDSVWNRLIEAKGLERLVVAVKLGTENMPAKGLCNNCTTNEIREAIQYMKPEIDTGL